MPLYAWLGWILLAFSIGFGLLQGGRPEQAGATMFAVAAALSVALRSTWPFRYRGVEHGLIWVDIALLVGLTMLTLRSRRLWPMGCVALHAISTMAHIARFFDPQATKTAYMLIATLSSFTTPALLIGGTIFYRKRLRANAAHYSNPSCDGPA